LVFFDALRVKIRDEGLVRNKAVHIALGVRADGTKEILPLAGAERLPGLLARAPLESG
jgi:transposase-like protein